MLESLFDKVAETNTDIFCEICEAATLFKRNSTYIFFCKICETFKNTYFKEHLRATASKLLFWKKPHLLIKIYYVPKDRSSPLKWSCKIAFFNNFTKFK